MIGRAARVRSQAVERKAEDGSMDQRRVAVVVGRKGWMRRAGLGRAGAQ